MKSARKCAIILLALAIPSPAFAQLQSERVEGSQRVCVYNGVQSEASNERRVGLGDPCPSYNKPLESGLAAPASARLQSVKLRDGKRVCSYAQLGRQWSFTLPMSRQCPSSAGMLQNGQ